MAIQNMRPRRIVRDARHRVTGIQDGCTLEVDPLLRHDENAFFLCLHLLNVKVGWVVVGWVVVGCVVVGCVAVVSS